jgi:hypothetical protein
MTLKALAVVQGTDADVLVKKGSGIFGGCCFDMAADGGVKIHDSATVAGAADTNLIAAAVSDIDVDGGTLQIIPPEPIRFTSGLVIVIADGASSVGAIWYK